ncbi:hypothetical protein ABTM14_20140, partial [Acinetobacter baumannii]
ALSRNTQMRGKYPDWLHHPRNQEPSGRGQQDSQNAVSKNEGHNDISAFGGEMPGIKRGVDNTGNPSRIRQHSNCARCSR